MGWKRLMTLWLSAAGAVSVVAFPAAVAGVLITEGIRYRKIKITPTGQTG